MTGVKIGQTITKDFITRHPVTREVTDADSLPTCEVFEDATDTPIETPTVTKRSGKTGNYRISCTCDHLNGFEFGKCYNFVAQATVGGVTDKAVIGSFVIEMPPLEAQLRRIVTGTDYDVIEDYAPGQVVGVDPPVRTLKATPKGGPYTQVEVM